VVDRTRAKWLIGGLIAAHVALHAVALSAMWPWPPLVQRPTALSRALLQVGPAQGALVALWAVLGGGRLLWRAPVVVLGAFAYLKFFGRADPDWLIAAIGNLAACTAILLVARWTGLMLVRQSDLAASLGPFQFYIRDMLVWTTVLAVLLSVWRCLPQKPGEFWGVTWAFWSLPINPQIDGAKIAGLAAVTVACLFCMLARGWILARAASVPLAIAAGVQLMVWTINSSRWDWQRVVWVTGDPVLAGSYCESFAFLAIWLAGSLFVLRAAGYRLARRPETVEMATEGAENTT
jgi:hypothetical protein